MFGNVGGLISTWACKSYLLGQILNERISTDISLVSSLAIRRTKLPHR